MHKNPLWLGFIGVIGIVVLGYSMHTVYLIQSQTALQKSLPIKECLYTVILWGILAYFISVGYYVGGQKGK